MPTVTDNKKEVDLDPIESEYNVYIKPKLSNGREIYVLQFPSRSVTEPYTEEKGMKPLELRVKPNSGLIELDVPLNPFVNYDRAKGLKWGDALKQSTTSKTQYGLPGGFGIGAQPGGRGRGRAIKEELEDLSGVSDQKFTAMLNQQRVMTKLTLGGLDAPTEPWQPQYMLGAFREGSLHLIPVKSIVQMTPQFHHIDAKADQDKQARPRDPAAGPPAAARAVHMTAKQTVDGEEPRQTTLFDMIRAAQEEPWRKMFFFDEASKEAWDKYEALFPIQGAAEDGEEPSLPKLQSTMSNEEYLDHISAPSNMAKLKKAKRTRKAKKEVGAGTDGNESSITLSDGDDDV